MSTVAKIAFYAVCTVIAIVIISGTVAAFIDISETKEEIAKTEAKIKSLEIDYYYQLGVSHGHKDCTKIIDSIIIHQTIK
jgi:hypothetical protein